MKYVIYDIFDKLFCDVISMGHYISDGWPSFSYFKNNENKTTTSPGYSQPVIKIFNRTIPETKYHDYEFWRVIY